MDQAAESLRDDIAVRATKRALVLALFKAWPGKWLSVLEIAHAGGFAAWRTRVSEARQAIEAEGGELLWNGKQKDSRYMYRPFQALGRDAAERVEQKGLF